MTESIFADIFSVLMNVSHTYVVCMHDNCDSVLDFTIEGMQ